MNTKTKIILGVSLLVIGFYILVEHRVHILGNFQYLIFGLFIIMHLYMHTGHGGHSKQKKGGHHE